MRDGKKPALATISITGAEESIELQGIEHHLILTLNIDIVHERGTVALVGINDA